MQVEPCDATGACVAVRLRLGQIDPRERSPRHALGHPPAIARRDRARTVVASLCTLQLIPESLDNLEFGERAQHTYAWSPSTNWAQPMSVTTTDRTFGIDHRASEQRGIDDDMQRIELSDRIVLDRLARPGPAHDDRQP